MSHTIKRDLDFLMSGNYEATNGIFGEVYVNRKIFPMDGKVFLRKRCRTWGWPRAGARFC